VKTFESQVQRNPDGIAISHGKLKYTYQELNKKSNQFAHYLRSQYQIKPNDLVCLCVDKNELMLIAILAVLKVGAAYVPMEPSYPEHRIEHILEDTKSMLLITNEQHVPRLHEVKRSHDVSFVCIDNLIASPVLINYPEENLGIAIPESNLAYVIYTSGTTGKPKGVLQTHGNVARLLLATEGLYGFHSGDVWTLFHAYVFDFSVWEIWGALAYGGKLVIPSHDQTRDFAEFHALCEREGVTVLNQTPSAFYQFMDFATEQKLEHLRYVIFGGEALHLPRLSHWFSCYGEDKPQLINMYGITETTVHVTYHRIKQDKLDERSQIGTVLSNLKAYVLDDALNPVPVYAIGELYVGGSSLACGYLNQEALTSERFIPSPFDEGRLYKTGDLVRWLPDGSLEYVGRNDFQVKIRGHRIELGEIESVLLSYPGMKQAVVLAKKQQSTEGYYLVGYCVSDGVYEEQALMNYLSHRLPDYMVPQVFVPLEKLPLTVNGKLDHQQLPEPVQKSSNVYVAPRSDLERQVCEIWAEVLGIPLDRLSIRDDFFRLGGDSIVSIQLSSRMRQRLGLVVSVRSIFNCRSIER
ncbi:amino acid adenylation domain-containing protein, partial [Legionella sp. km535]|uniref:non-ribosomal peptide synthetase n=1 Tax=Legionella sp. km535 TaxID=2498107 RepID=UPI000F8CB4A9